MVLQACLCQSALHCTDYQGIGPLCGCLLLWFCCFPFSSRLFAALKSSITRMELCQIDFAWGSVKQGTANYTCHLKRKYKWSLIAQYILCFSLFAVRYTWWMAPGVLQCLLAIGGVEVSFSKHSIPTNGRPILIDKHIFPMKTAQPWACFQWSCRQLFEQRVSNAG
jgi:hypothetical protein